MGDEHVKNPVPGQGRDPELRASLDTPAELTGNQKDTRTELSALFAPALCDGEIGWLAQYRVLQVLGRGGMGAVFKAEDTHLQRIVALKVILPQLVDESMARERFLREARAAAALKNDHVVTVYQVGQDRDVPFLAMEYLAGESLESRLSNGQPLPVPEVVRFGREIATGLAAAHARGLIHRDIKPANIWLEETAAGPRVKLLDFGLARAASGNTNLTQTGNVVGTPSFMSPEQARGEKLDGRSDLFSLGSVLYAMCSGRPPFRGDSMMALLTALAVDTPQPLRDVNPNVPPRLADLVAHLMQKKPDDRPATADEVRQRLAAIEAGATGAAPRGTRRSWRTLAAGLAALAVTVVLGLAALAYLGAKAERDLPPAGNEAAAPTGVPVRLGVLHSSTGSMSIVERPIIDAILLAVDEINDAGGVLGRPVEPVIADGASDEAIFAREAEKLISDQGVRVLFGCWTSATRKAVLPVVERHDNLLFYYVRYEGIEQSPNVVYLGPTPKQLIVPALRWLIGFEGKRRWFVVGSESIYSATAQRIIEAEAKERGAEIVGSAYVPLDYDQVGPIVQRLVQARPDLIVNNMTGERNIVFLRSLRRAGVKSRELPMITFALSELEFNILGAEAVAGHYVAASYFQSLDLPANQKFLERFADRYGAHRFVSASMAAAYGGVHLWAQSVRAAGSDGTRAVRAALKAQTLDAPQGKLRIDPATQHAVQVTRVGRFEEGGRLVPVYTSPEPVAPEPYPTFLSRAEWDSFLNKMYLGWGKRWSSQDD